MSAPERCDTCGWPVDGPEHTLGCPVGRKDHAVASERDPVEIWRNLDNFAPRHQRHNAGDALAAALTTERERVAALEKELEWQGAITKALLPYQERVAALEAGLREIAAMRINSKPQFIARDLLEGTDA